MELKNKDPGETGPTSPTKALGIYPKIVVFSSAIIQFFYGGLNGSVGIFFVTYIEEFSIFNSQAAVVGALHVGMPFILSPLVSLVLEKVSIRAVLMTGSLVFAAGYISAFFTRSYIGLVFAMGLLPGIGAAGSVLATATIVGQYFDQRRSLAISLIWVGGGLGTMVLPHAVQALINAFSWRGACLVIGGLHLHIIPLAMCLIESPNHYRRPKLPNSIHVTKLLVSTDTVSRAYNSDEQNVKVGTATERPLIEEQNTDIKITSTESRLEQGVLKEDLRQHKLQGRNSLLGVLGGSRATMYSQLSLASPYKHDEDTCKKIETVLRSKRIMFLAIQNIIFFTGGNAVFHFVPAHAIKLGIARINTSWLITAIGLGCLIGMPLWGHMADFGFIKRHLTILYLMGISACGLTFVLEAYCSTFPWFIVFSGAVGFALAANYSLCPALVIYYISPQHLSISYSVLLMAEGIGLLIGPPLTGFIYDVTGSYAVAMQACGGVIFLAVAVMVLQQLLYRCRCITT